MKQLKAVTCVSALLASVAVYADVAVYHDGKLLIDAVASVDDDEMRYYRDVQLVAQAGDMLEVDSAAPRPLARVEEAEVLLLQATTLQASVSATGFLSVSCVALEPPAVTRRGNEFSVVLAETVLPEGRVCMSLVAVTPFDVSIPLDISGLDAGSYSVRVNDVQLDFELEQDQP